MKETSMKLDFTEFLFAMSYALDAVEIEFLGQSTGHGEDVAWLTYQMAAVTGASVTRKREAAFAGLLHDNGMAPFFRMCKQKAMDSNVNPSSLSMAEEMEENAGGHCISGEENMHLLPFETDMTNVILYHHENADGTGPFHKKGKEIPLLSQIIHLADCLDIRFDIRSLDQAGLAVMRSYVHANKHTLFTPEVVNLFDRAVSYEVLSEAASNGIEECLRKELHGDVRDYSEREIRNIAAFFERIIDYKSSFTMVHSAGVADKAEKMARYYQWDDDKVLRFYFAGAFHDIGKMLVTNDILEKPDRLTAEEYGKMQNHAAATYELLSRIPGLEDISNWSGRHHEKLDGTGYTLGLKEKDLSKEDKIMACCDIYQALTEQRPYKEGLPHRKAIAIMKSMAADHKIDGDIVNDMDAVFSTKEEETAETNTAGGKKWKCPLCGYIYEGEEPPAKCPLCGAPGYRFEPVN